MGGPRQLHYPTRGNTCARSNELCVESCVASGRRPGVTTPTMTGAAATGIRVAKCDERLKDALIEQDHVAGLRRDEISPQHCPFGGCRALLLNSWPIVVVSVRVLRAPMQGENGETEGRDRFRSP